MKFQAYGIPAMPAPPSRHCLKTCRPFQDTFAARSPAAHRISYCCTALPPWKALQTQYFLFDMAEIAVNLLHDAVSGKLVPKRTVLPVCLIERETT